jgi:1-phosphofructokinase
MIVAPGGTQDGGTATASRRDGVCVFDPSLLLTVVVEPSDSCDEIHLHPGGQGFWIARMARHLGADVQLISSFGGETGTLIRPLIATYGVRVVATSVAGGNGAYIQDRRSGARASVAESVSLPLTRHEVDDLYGVALAAAAGCGVVVLAGPRPPNIVPAELYGRLAADLATLGTPVVADLSGAALKAVLAGGVRLLKISEDDMRRDGLLAAATHAGRLELMNDLQRGGADAVVLTRGNLPALALAGDEVMRIQSPGLRAVDHRGAGDAMTAAMAVAVGGGSSLIDALRLGAAAGAAAVTRRGLASGQREEVEALVPYVEITPFDPSMA